MMRVVLYSFDPRSAFLLLLLALGCVPCTAQVDTIAIAKRLEQLTDLESHKAFWSDIRHRDQEFRGHQAVEAIDELNLVTVSMYYNRFGIPRAADLGNHASIISTVWIHNRSTVVDAMTFPLVLGRFLSGELDEKTLREYQIRVLYHRKFDDNGHLTKPLPQLFMELKLNVSRHIDIAKLLTTFEEYHTFKSQTKILIGTWKTPDISRSYQLNDSPYDVTFTGDLVEIYRLDSGTYYYNALHSDTSYDPAELIPLDADLKRFKFNNRISDKFFDWSSGTELVLTDSTGTIHRTYNTVSQN
jgi:hypothetical protein